MTIVFWILMGILSYYISYKFDELIKYMLYDRGYILNSRIAKLNKYASTNIISLEKSPKEKIINILKKLVFFVPGVNLIILMTKYTQYMFKDKYIDKLIKHNKVTNINSSEAISALNIEKEVNKLLTEKKQDIFNKIIVFLDNTLGKWGLLNVTIDDKVIVGKKDKNISEEVKRKVKSKKQAKKVKKTSIDDKLDIFINNVDTKTDAIINKVDIATDKLINQTDLFVDRTVDKVDSASDKLIDGLDKMGDGLDKMGDNLDKVITKILKL